VQVTVIYTSNHQTSETSVWVHKQMFQQSVISNQSVSGKWNVSKLKMKICLTMLLTKVRMHKIKYDAA